MKAFDFHEANKKRDYLVESLVPMRTLCLLTSMSGVGKSILLEYLATCLVYGHTFLGMKIKASDVLLIDQDSSVAELEKRLCAFAKYMESKGYKQIRKLYVEPTVEDDKSYSLSDGSLISLMQSQKAGVILIDSLGSVCSGLDTNSSRDMAKLNGIREVIRNDNKTVIMVHHASDKKWTLEDIMAIQDPSKLPMGSSVIRQKMDMLLYVSRKENIGKINRLYIRPDQKRLSLQRNKPFVIKLWSKKDTLHFVMEGEYKQPKSGEEKQLLRLFIKSPKPRTVPEICRDMNEAQNMYTIRKTLPLLEASGHLVQNKCHKKMFTWELAPKWKKLKSIE